MDRCQACGAALTPDASWCAQCFAAVVAPAPPFGSRPATGPAFGSSTGSAFGSGTGSGFGSAGSGSSGGGPAAGAVATPTRAAMLPVTTPPPVLRTSRWRKTPTTFGPIGRVSATLALVVPLSLMVVGGFGDIFAWGGAAFWVAVVMPLCLRDIWKAGVLPAPTA